MHPTQHQLGTTQDHREQIVEVVRDAGRHLTQRAQPLGLHELTLAALEVLGHLLGLPSPALGLAVELRLHDGDGRLVGQQPHELFFLVGEVAALAEQQRQHPHGRAFGGHERDAGVRAHVPLGDDALVQEPWLGSQIAHEQRLARREHGAREAVAVGDGLEPGEVLAKYRIHRHGALDAQHAARGIVDPDLTGARGQEPHGRLRDGAEDLAARGRAGDQARQGAERGELVRPLGGAPVEIRVFQRDRRLGGEHLGDVDVVLGERPDEIAIDDDGAERAVAGEQRHRQHRAVALRLDDGARGRRQLDRRIGQDVGGPHRAPLLDGDRRRAVPPRQRPQPLRERRRQAAHGAEPDVRPRLGALEHRNADAARAQQQTGLIHDAIEHTLQVERRGDRARDVDHRLALRDAAPQRFGRALVLVAAPLRAGGA